jgi:hypothetical protein
MRSIRRLYLYAVAFISLEVVLWGLIGLARSTFSPDLVAGPGNLARALALILVGVPIFGLHWGFAQRSAALESEERTAGLRAVFLYGVMLATLLPVVQNTLALVNRLLVTAAGLDPWQAALGRGQTWGDNLIAILMNLVVAVYFYSIQRRDWQEITGKEAIADVRRLYRYIWVAYGLGLSVFGLQQILRFVFELRPDELGLVMRAWLLNGLALTLVGTPLWVFTWKIVQDSLVEQAERLSSLRLGVLYLLSLAGVFTVLTSAGMVLNAVLRAILGEAMTLTGLMNQVSGPLSMGLPLAGVWAYYGHWLNRDMAGLADTPRRAGLRRLYNYILSLIGLGATFFGIAMLLAFLTDLLLSDGFWGWVLRNRLSAALATLLVGLPLWLRTWFPMQAESLQADDSGDHARRSVVRRAYLYLVLFVSVIGGMVAAVQLVFLLLSSLLGAPPASFLQEFLEVIRLLLLFLLLLLYHGRTLRQDSARAAHSLSNRHALFPVLVLELAEAPYASEVFAALQQQAPRLPVAVQAVADGLSAEALGTIKAVVLPGPMAVEPPEALRLWLREFKGHKVVVPVPAADWVWAGGAPAASAAARHAALALRQLAEGQELRPPGPSSPWMIVLYVFAVLFGLQLLIVLAGLFFSALMN